MSLPKVICIVGQTATGKTALGIHLAKKYNGEIISADSRQIYRGMDIGTAKEKGKWKTIDVHRACVVKGVPHYGFDLVNPNESFTVVDFQRYAQAVIADIHARGKVPFIVGGTGLYVQAVIDNFLVPGVPPNTPLRKQIHTLMEEKGLRAVYLELLKLDPKAADFIAPQNARRVIRALEVCLATGKPFSKQKKRGKRLYRTLSIALDLPRPSLYKKLDERTAAQISGGLIPEVRKLLKTYDPSLPPFVGMYHEITRYLQKEITLKEAEYLIRRHMHAYARRQYTWFRRDKQIHWVETSEEAENIVKKFLGVR